MPVARATGLSVDSSLSFPLSPAPLPASGERELALMSIGLLAVRQRLSR